MSFPSLKDQQPPLIYIYIYIYIFIFIIQYGCSLSVVDVNIGYIGEIANNPNQGKLI